MGVNRVRHTSPTKPARANGTGVGHADVAMRGVTSTAYSILRRVHWLGGSPAWTAVGVGFEHGQNVVLKRRSLSGACGVGSRGGGI